MNNAEAAETGAQPADGNNPDTNVNASDDAAGADATEAPADGASITTTPDSVDGDMSVTSSAESVDQDDNNRLPTIALLRTFVLSFFASLIPETPAV